MQRHVGKHRLHQRLIGEMFLEHAAMSRVMQRMREPRPHQAGGGNRAILPRQLHHLDDGADALALVADALRIGAGEFHLGRRIGAVAELVLQALELDRVDRSIRLEARHEKTGQSFVGLRQHQEGVAHRRRHEPFMPGDTIGVAGAFSARHVGAHVGAALLLGHAHAKRHAALGPPRREAGIIGAGRDHRHRLRQQVRLRRQCRHRRARHGDRAQMTGLDLGGHIELRGTHHFGGTSRRLAQDGPGRIVQAGVGAACHQLVIGRVKLDFVAPDAAGIERPQFGRVLVGDAAPCRHDSRTPLLPELGQFLIRRSAAVGRHRIRQRPVQRKQIDVFERRRLVEHLVGRE